MSQLKGWKAGEFSINRGEVSFLFFSVLQVITWGLPTLRRATCFTQSIHLNANLIPKYLHRNTQNNVWPNIWAPCGLVKLTHKINDHTYKCGLQESIQFLWGVWVINIWGNWRRLWNFHFYGPLEEDETVISLGLFHCGFTLWPGNCLLWTLEIFF